MSSRYGVLAFITFLISLQKFTISAIDCFSSTEVEFAYFTSSNNFLEQMEILAFLLLIKKSLYFSEYLYKLDSSSFVTLNNAKGYMRDNTIPCVSKSDNFKLYVGKTFYNNFNWCAFTDFYLIEGAIFANAV